MTSTPMNTHITNASSWAIGTSSDESTTITRVAGPRSAGRSVAHRASDGQPM